MNRYFINRLAIAGLLAIGITAVQSVRADNSNHTSVKIHRFTKYKFSAQEQKTPPLTIKWKRFSANTHTMEPKAKTAINKAKIKKSLIHVKAKAKAKAPITARAGTARAGFIVEPKTEIKAKISVRKTKPEITAKPETTAQKTPENKAKNKAKNKKVAVNTAHEKA